MIYIRILRVLRKVSTASELGKSAIRCAVIHHKQTPLCIPYNRIPEEFLLLLSQSISGGITVRQLFSGFGVDTRLLLW